VLPALSISGTLMVRQIKYRYFSVDTCAYQSQNDTRSPVSAARLTASITLSVFSPSRPLTTGVAVPRITPQKFAICRPSGSSFSNLSRSRSIGAHQLALLG
jgi:hypothetical protein